MGVEYSYQKRSDWRTGVYSCNPRQAPGFEYFRTVDIGNADLTFRGMDFHRLFAELQGEWIGRHYELTRHNCNHFTEEFCQRLVPDAVEGVPSWVNALARIGDKINFSMQAKLKPPDANQP